MNRLGMFTGYRRRRFAPWVAAFAVLTAIEIAIALPLVMGPSQDAEESADGTARGIVGAAVLNEEPSTQAGAVADRGRATLGKRASGTRGAEGRPSQAHPFTGGEEASDEATSADSSEDFVAAAALPSGDSAAGAEGDTPSSQGEPQRSTPPQPRPAEPLRRTPPSTTTTQKPPPPPPTPPASLPPTTTDATTTTTPTTTTTTIEDPPPTTTGEPPDKCKKRCRGRGRDDGDD